MGFLVHIVTRSMIEESKMTTKVSETRCKAAKCIRSNGIR